MLAKITRIIVLYKHNRSNKSLIKEISGAADQECNNGTIYHRHNEIVRHFSPGGQWLVVPCHRQRLHPLAVPICPTSYRGNCFNGPTYNSFGRLMPKVDVRDIYQQINQLCNDVLYCFNLLLHMAQTWEFVCSLLQNE